MNLSNPGTNPGTKTIPDSCFRGEHDWGGEPNLCPGLDARCIWCGQTLRQACQELIRELDQHKQGRYQ